MLQAPLLLHVEAFYSCPWACSCYVALREKGLPFTTSLALVFDEQILHRSYQENSVTARVPALQHGSFWVAESQAIVEYLDERFPPPEYPRVLPADLQERARARQVMAWLRSDLYALRDEWDTVGIFYPMSAPPPSACAAREIEKLVAVALRLVPEGATRMFREWTIADLDLAFALQRLRVYGHPLPPRLTTFIDANWSRPSVREYALHPRPPFGDWRPLPSGRRP
jgi:glutathione S-transferase